MFRVGNVKWYYYSIVSVWEIIHSSRWCDKKFKVRIIGAIGKIKKGFPKKLR